MAEEVKYYEAVIDVSGTTRLGVYARSEEEALELLEEHIDLFGVDNYSSDLDLDDCEVFDISEYTGRTAYEVINSKDELEEGC